MWLIFIFEIFSKYNFLEENKLCSVSSFMKENIVVDTVGKHPSALDGGP